MRASISSCNEFNLSQEPIAAGGVEWTVLELEIMLIRYYTFFFPQNVHIAKNLAKHYSGSLHLLQQQLLDKYGERLECVIVAEAGAKEKLRVWVGSIKLENKFPTSEVLQRILYGNPSNSAEGADVVALHLTDLLVKDQEETSLQNLLRKSLRDAEDYVFNEDDRGLVLHNIPAQLTGNFEDRKSFVSLSVAVHKRNVQDTDGDGNLDHHDCFPLPVYLTCKSARSNEVSACGKAILAQDVILMRGGTPMDLVLLAANLDTDDGARHHQILDAQRLLQARRGQRPFCALIWGDLGNRLVAFEGLRRHATETDGKWVLQDSGVELLVDMVKDGEGRRELLRKDSLVYSGKDVCGRQHQVPQGNELLRQLFALHVDAVLSGELPAPLPSYKRSPLDRTATELLGVDTSWDDAVCLDSLRHSGSPQPGAGPESQGLSSKETSLKGTRAAYFGWCQRGKDKLELQRTIKVEKGDGGKATPQLYLQLGWLDGVGVYRGEEGGKGEGETVKASLKWWETVEQVQAFDHLPIRAVVSVPCAQGQPLRVWLCAVKLDHRHPTPEALESLLYGSEEANADDADVIALSFTDLVLNKANVESLRRMLRRAVRSPDQYIFNEDDGGLVLRHIPAQLVRAGEGGERFVSLSVAVHRRNVQDYDGDGNLDHNDCFPLPVYLTCKSARKNEVSACGKAILAQDVVITRGETAMDLVLLAANLDTDDGAKLGQLKELKRLLRARQGQRPFCALIWGDLNNRLVAFDGLRQHATENKGKWVLLDSGVDLLVKQIDDPAGRLDLLRYDSLEYAGNDLSGRKFKIPDCHTLLRDMFSLHIDAVRDQGLRVPMPSYKRTPLDVLASSYLGCCVRFRDVVCRSDDLIEGLNRISQSKSEDFCRDYFGWKIHGDNIQRSIAPPGEDEEVDGGPADDIYDAAQSSNSILRMSSRQYFGQSSGAFCLQLGWPDGVGIYRGPAPAGGGATVTARIAAWETDDRVLAFDHLPIRATILIDEPDSRRTGAFHSQIHHTGLAGLSKSTSPRSIAEEFTP